MTLCVRAIQAHTGPVSYGFTERESVSDGLNRRAFGLDGVEPHGSTHQSSLRTRHPTIQTSSWLLCQLVDGSAQVPTKDVPSCDKPWGAARRRRTMDLLMGIPPQLPRAMGNAPD